MCAIEAGKRGRRVLVLERSERIGKKILISGGGRCNFTNLYTQPENFLSDNPHFCRSALARYTPADFIALVEKHGIAYHEKTLGQLFCDGSSSQIVDDAGSECRDAGVEIRVDQVVDRVERDGGFNVVTTSTESCIARRWWSPRRSLHSEDGCHWIWIRSGATIWRRQFGNAGPRWCHSPSTSGDLTNYGDLSGISAEVVASIESQQVPREDADHPSRAERPGDPADLFLLEPAAAGRHRPRSGA